MARGQAGTRATRASSRKLRDFSKSLPMSLLRAREAVMRHFRVSLRKHNLTEQQWRVLRALSSVETCDATDLATATFLLAPSLSRILRDLDARGLIDRHNPQVDLRRSRVSISARGHRLLETVSPESEGVYGRITDAFGEDNLTLLQDLLHDLERCLDDSAPDEGSPGA